MFLYDVYIRFIAVYFSVLFDFSLTLGHVTSGLQYLFSQVAVFTVLGSETALWHYLSTSYVSQ